MPEASYPVVALVVAMFTSFIVVLASVSLWSAMPDRSDRKS